MFQYHKQTKQAKGLYMEFGDGGRQVHAKDYLVVKMGWLALWEWDQYVERGNEI